jgi:hypothetical protein
MDARSATIAIPVRYRTLDYVASEAFVTECPHCYALVRESRVDDHLRSAHDKVATT